MSCNEIEERLENSQKVKAILLKPILGMNSLLLTGLMGDKIEILDFIRESTGPEVALITFTNLNLEGIHQAYIYPDGLRVL